MPDLVVINPGGGNIIYQDLDTHLTAIDPPVWCRLIAGYCADRGHSVAIHDGQFDMPMPVADVLYCVVVHGHQPNASAQCMEDAIRGIREMRAQGIETPIIVVGGVAATLPERVMQDTGAEYVCTGEGPVTVEEMLRWIKADGISLDIPDIYHKSIMGYRRTDPAPLVNMDDLHGDVWDMLPMDRYRAHNWQCFDGSPRTPYASIHTSLGCPYKCVFCCINAPFHGPNYRTRKPVDVINEVSRLYHYYDVRTFRIVDEMFVLKPSHYQPICEGLACLPYADELNIWAYARVDTVRSDNLALLRRAGIRWLCLGIESGSAHVRNGSQKSIDSDDIRDVVKAIQKAGINVLGNFIFGLPDDTIESMGETFALARSIECEYSNFYSAMAYPGSALYTMTKPEDLPERWSGYSQHSRDTKPLPTAKLGARDVLWFRDQAFKSYFTDPAYIDRIGEKFGDHAVREVELMNSYKLERTLLG